jgi:hypothetical protein
MARDAGVRSLPVEGKADRWRTGVQVGPVKLKGVRDIATRDRCRVAHAPSTSLRGLIGRAERERAATIPFDHVLAYGADVVLLA